MSRSAGRWGCVFFLYMACLPIPGKAETEISISQNLAVVDTYHFVEVSIEAQQSHVANPFTEVEVTGTFWKKGKAGREVIGFCDSEDGSVFKIRFMPSEPGDYSYVVKYRESDGFSKEFKGRFRAKNSGNKGIVRVDPKHAFHFIWEGTGEHYFYNGTTAYHLLSWTDEERMLRCIERIAATGCNRIRFLNYGRASDGEWGEGMAQSGDFTWTLCPWPAKHPARQLKEGSPEFDHTRFNLAHWRKCEKALRRMRDLNVVASVIMLMDRGIKDAPPPGSQLEKMYYRYAVARCGAFSNVMWDLGNEHREYRSPEWGNEIGGRIKRWDCYEHLVSAHGHETFDYDLEKWAGFAMYQKWRDGQNPFMLAQRADAVARRRIIPQINEEYGYEMHRDCGQEEVRRRAWEIAMAGCYQTTGEWKGWQHGEAVAESKILTWTGHMRKFFEENLPWWEMEPANEIVKEGKGYVLAKKGKCYAIYLPEPGRVTLDLEPGEYMAKWFVPELGFYLWSKREGFLPGRISGGRWQSPVPPAVSDWVLLISE